MASDALGTVFQMIFYMNTGGVQENAISVAPGERVVI